MIKVFQIYMIVLAMVIFTLNTSNASADTLTEAVDKALKGEEVKFVNVDGHEFHIKPITVVKGEKGVGASGQISHHLSMRPDDQITYKITVKEGATETTTNIERGGLGRLVGVPGNIANKAGKLIDGTWESALVKIINVISLKLELQ